MSLPGADNRVASTNLNRFAEAAAALRKFTVAPGFKVEVFAAEPLLQNPVSLAFDEVGRLYVVETHRRRTSVFDIRKFPEWLDADFSLRTVDDRMNFLKRTVTQENQPFIDRIRKDAKPGSFGDYNKDGKIDWHDLEVESERIRRIVDRDGDGKADEASIFSDGCNSVVSGVAAGVLARKGKFWFTCIPDLWQLEDRDGDGKAELRRRLRHGFGVHVAIGGHDLHGLRFGPEGKLYFSVGDRGSNVQAEGRTIALPDTGAIFRCNPDGSDLEEFASGLRNPHELAFDQFGNLWTADNNGDGGDKARLVYVVEGGNSGWTIGWQWLPQMGAWQSEKLWHLSPTNTAASLLPPVAHVGHGPAGFAFYPGTGLPREFDHHFVLADFPGGVRSFAVKERGASFVIETPNEHLQDNSPTNRHGKLLWNLYPVDVEFGPHGGLYVADWIEGWEKTGKGRIFRLLHPEAMADPIVAETRRLLAEGMERRAANELARLLAHRDMRLRQEAQFELAGRGEDGLETLLRVAGKAADQRARLHAIWGLGQISAKAKASRVDLSEPSILGPVAALLADADAEIRAQAAKVLGEDRFSAALPRLLALLRDESLRVRFFAAMAAGKMRHSEVVGPILDLLAENGDRDPYLRHAGVMALVWSGDPASLIEAAEHKSPAARMAALLALRRLHRPEVARSLVDRDATIVLEAARAIHDEPIADGMSLLAALLNDWERLKVAPSVILEAILRRGINANFRLGKTEHAIALAELAANPAVPEVSRVEALQALGEWVRPPARDRVTGLWQPLAPREGRSASIPLRSELERLLESNSDAVRVAAMQAMAKLGIDAAGQRVFAMAGDRQAKREVRVAALQALRDLKDPKLPEAVQLAVNSEDEVVRREAAKLDMTLGPTQTKLAALLNQGSVAQQQQALRALGELDGAEADSLIGDALDRLLAGTLPKELHLDLLEAAQSRNSPKVQAKLRAYESSRDKSDALAAYREALHGGDSNSGKKIFFEHQEAACFRCHKISGVGGEVGPELSGIGARQDRSYLIESVLFPNQQIAQGYETQLITTRNGTTYAGILKSEQASELVISSLEDGVVTIKRADIQARERGLSAMPEGLEQILSKQDLRDLVEFLAQQR
ncbi:MAG: HEAT repeat domain-containing protein, partial [Verrucomicrobiales bacterium]|nr:HEAT repeat domain-containing protein [Verrucomicrobiales bacterium]